MTLSQRIASMTGPDRAVDAEVAVALGLLEPEWAAECVAWGDQELHPECPAHGALPRFTASLDAAMSVVPERWNWAVAVSMDEGFMAGLQRGDPFFEHHDACAATPALALLSAAMQARGL